MTIARDDIFVIAAMIALVAAGIVAFSNFITSLIIFDCFLFQCGVNWDLVFLLIMLLLLAAGSLGLGRIMGVPQGREPDAAPQEEPDD